MDRTNAEMKNLEVTWIGTVKNKTTGKEKPSLQVMRDNRQGAKEVFYMDSVVPLDNIKIGQRLDVVVQLRAYKDKIYMSLMELMTVPNARQVKV